MCVQVVADLIERDSAPRAARTLLVQSLLGSVCLAVLYILIAVMVGSLKWPFQLLSSGSKLHADL